MEILKFPENFIDMRKNIMLIKNQTLKQLYNICT